MADHPLRPATDHRLGRPLPHQLANRTQAPPEALKLSLAKFPPSKAHAVLATVSSGYPPLQGRSPTCYSPVRHFQAHRCTLTFDLHVLGTPPAFILSQDQTLHILALSETSLSASSSFFRPLLSYHSSIVNVLTMRTNKRAMPMSPLA